MLRALAVVLALGALGPGTGWAEDPEPSPWNWMQAPPVALSEYWIGLECHPPVPALCAQLGVAEGRGLVVVNVAEASPAEKAGFQKHDFLTAAGAHELAGIADLVAAVDEAKDSPLNVEIIRGGKPRTIEVVPEKRPEPPAAEGMPFPRHKQLDEETIRKWLELVQPDGAKRPYRFRVFQPGWILPPNAPAQPPLPKGTSVTISKKGDEPASIKVRRGDESWDVTEGELDKLPEDLRPHVESMLGPKPFWGPGDTNVYEFAPNLPEMPEMPEMPEPFRKQMKKMSTEIQQLREKLDGLLDQRSAKPQPDASPETESGPE